jgi:hypothetical protein
MCEQQGLLHRLCKRVPAVGRLWSIGGRGGDYHWASVMYQKASVIYQGASVIYQRASVMYQRASVMYQRASVIYQRRVWSIRGRVWSIRDECDLSGGECGLSEGECDVSEGECDLSWANVIYHGRNWSIRGRVWSIRGRVWPIRGRVWSIIGRVWCIWGRVWSIRGECDYQRATMIYQGASVIYKGVCEYDFISPTEWRRDDSSEYKLRFLYKSLQKCWYMNSAILWFSPTPHYVFHFLSIQLLCCSCRWGETMSLNCGHQRAYCSSPRLIWVWRATVEWCWQGKTRELGNKPVPVPLCPTQIPHGLPGANPGLCCERPATNRLSHSHSVTISMKQYARNSQKHTQIVLLHQILFKTVWDFRFSRRQVLRWLSSDAGSCSLLEIYRRLRAA